MGTVQILDISEPSSRIQWAFLNSRSIVANILHVYSSPDARLLIQLLDPDLACGLTDSLASRQDHPCSVGNEFRCILGSSFNLLPNDDSIIVFAYAMINPVAVDLASCIHRSREPQERPSREARLYEKWLGQLDRDQKQHQVDWMMANNINRRFRTICVAAFFANLIFAFRWRELKQMEEGNLNGMSALNTTVAVSHISSLQALVPRKCMIHRDSPSYRSSEFRNSSDSSLMLALLRQTENPPTDLLPSWSAPNCNTKNMAKGESVVQFLLAEESANANRRLSELVRNVFKSYC